MPLLLSLSRVSVSLPLVVPTVSALHCLGLSHFLSLALLLCYDCTRCGPLGYLSHKTSMHSMCDADVVIALGTRQVLELLRPVQFHFPVCLWLHVSVFLGI